MEYDSLISKLKELEVRCVSSDFENFDVSPILEQLESVSNSELNSVFKFIVSRMTQHEYRAVLEAPLSEIGLSFNEEDGLFHYPESSSDSEETIKTYLKQLVLLFVGVSALQEFVRANICGPCPEMEALSPLVCSEPLYSCGDDECVKQYLCKDMDYALTNICHPKLLYMSIKLMSSAGFKEEYCITRKWWLLRCTMVHQRVLAEAISSMHDQMVVLVEDVLNLPWTMNDKYTSLLLLFYIECEQMYLYYQRVSDAGKFLTHARELSGLSVELSGAYGKRTRFQQRALPQLFVQLHRKTKAIKQELEQTDESGFPPDLQLQDDTLLNNVSFSDGGEAIRNLSDEEQIVLFGEYSFLKLSGAWDNLQKEEMLSYVNCMLAQRKVWSVFSATLVLRCNLEKTSTRCMDRALRQLEAIIDCVKKDLSPLKVRLPYLHAVAFPMLWSLEKMLASQLMAMGATKTALDVYKRLNLWEDLVLCYQLLGRTASAVELLEDRLKIEETPLLYCLLGDVLDDPKMYEKAESLSGTPSARSQRSLGHYYYKKKDYSTCIPYFQKSVEINYLQGNVWFDLGYAALQCEMYDLAARAYRQVVVLDDDNFQAWNNLSHAYIKSGQKVRAYNSLQEALKCNYEEWRVWENFLLVCVDIGAFEDAIRAYHRIADIKDKYVDVQVLEILVKAINTNINDFRGSPASRLRSLVQKLFGRVTSKVCKEYKVWEMYSMLLCPDPESATDLETVSKALRQQQQAAVCCSWNDNWPSDVAAFRTVLQTCQRYLYLFSSLSRLLVEPKEKAENRTVVKLMTKRILTRADNSLVNFQDPEKSELQDLLSSVTALCNRVVEL